MVAIVVPEKEQIEKWAKENGVEGDYEKIIADEKTNKFYLEEMKRLSKEAGVSTFILICL